MQPEKLVDPIGVEQVNFYLETLRIPTTEWLPTTWASEGITAYGEGRSLLNYRYALWLWSAAISTMLFAFFVFKKFWWRARSGGSGAEVTDTKQKRTKVKQHKPGKFRSSLMYRDMILFSRDPGQWSQLIVIAALVVIYVFNFKNLPYALYDFQYSMSFVSVGATGLILSALLARFGFPAVSAEGKAIWLLRTSPVNWRHYLWQKFLFLIIPTVLIGSLLVLFSVRILDVNNVVLLKCLFLEMAIASGCTGMAIGMGAKNPRFDIKDAAMVAVSTGGLWYMLFAIFFISFAITLVVLPDSIRYLSIGYRWLNSIRNVDRYIVWLILFITTALVVYIPMELGVRNLQKMDS